MANHRNFAETTLAAAITDTSGTSITVTSETSFPAAPFIISIDTECMLVTNVSTTTWTVTRGYEGSTAATHTNGAAIYHDISAAEADAIAGKLDKAGGTMSGAINMGNQDITYLKLLELNGEIDDGAGVSAIDWNAGAAHKVTLTANTTLAFTGYGADETLPGGIITAYNPWYPAANAFDNSTDYGYTHSFSSHSSPTWITYQFPEAKTIKAYTIASAKSGDFGGYAIQSWTLQGSMNGTDWTILDTRNNAFGPTENQVKKVFDVTSPGSYIYYKINITVPDEPISVAEIEYIEDSVTNPTAPCFLALKLVQDATGGRTVTWPATVKGTPAVNLAANAVSNVLLYWDGTYYWVLNGKQFSSATDKLIGRSTAGAGELEEIACTAAGRALLDDANAAEQLATLGAAAAATAPVISTGTAAPTSTPAKVGNIYIDTTGAKAYIAKGTSSSADWMLLN